MEVVRAVVDRKVHLWVVFVIFVGLFGGALVWTKYYQAPLSSFTITTASGTPITLGVGATPALSNPDFYAQVRTKLISDHTDFIEANLSTMKLSVYQNGQVVKEVPILTKGRKGSWWETPAGLYKVEDKIKKHKSSFSPVYTDWNLHFQGNFFIHGWPYWADSGDPVTSTYSGGCIRLSTDDAKAVYDLAVVDEPVLVYEDAPSDIYSYSANLPAITATSYVAVDLDNNFAFLSQNATTPTDLPMTERLLTALVSTEYMDIERPVAMSGKTYTVYDILFPLLEEGREDAAAALRAELGPNYAVNLANQKATAIGMRDTSLSRGDNGVSASSSAEDIFYLTKYLYNYRKFILDLSRGVVTDSAYGESAFKNVSVKNPASDLPGFLGGAFDKSDAGESALAVFKAPFGGDTRPVAIVVLDSQDARADIQNILTYIANSYRIDR